MKYIKALYAVAGITLAGLVISVSGQQKGSVIGFNPPTSAAPSGAAGGDLSGTYPNPNVAKVNGVSYASIATLAANTFTARQLGFSGDCTSPSWAISNDTQTGIGNASLSQLSLCANGTQGAQMSPTVFNFVNAQPQAKQYLTTTNCLSVASPAACVAAPSGSSNIVAATTSEVVNTTAVTANSNIQITEDSGLGTRLGVTCNTQSSLVVGTPRVTARSAGTSFTVTVDVAPTTNPLCFSYAIQN